MKTIVKNAAGTFEISFDYDERIFEVWELNAEGKPFIYLGGFYYLETAEEKLAELDKQHRKLIKSMLDSEDPVYVAYAKMMLETAGLTEEALV